MINFEEELKKFYPSLEVEQIEDNIHNKNLTDMVDLMEEMVKEYSSCLYMEVAMHNKKVLHLYTLFFSKQFYVMASTSFKSFFIQLNTHV